MEKIKYLKNGKMVEVEVDKAEETYDGFHSFKELYEHRKVLSALAFKLGKEKKWKVFRSKKHAGEDGPIFGGGWFIVGVIRPDGKQYSYHYELKDWDLFSFAEEWPESPEWDGHMPNDIDRLLELLN